MGGEFGQNQCQSPEIHDSYVTVSAYIRVIWIADYPLLTEFKPEQEALQ